MKRIHIPRPLKACIYIVLVMVLAVVFYISSGCPTLTFQQEFRRAEKVNLVGPSQIVQTLDGVYQDFDKMIVGETEHGICFFGRYYGSAPYNAPFAEKQYLFTYREKTGDITVAAAPNVWGYFWHPAGVTLPVLLFADIQDAVRAEVEITVKGTYTSHVNGEEITRSFHKAFHANAKRSETGVFCFLLSSSDEGSALALRLLSNVSSGTPALSEEDQAAIIPVTVRLYDSNNHLLIEKELIICSDSEKTYFER